MSIKKDAELHSPASSKVIALMNFLIDFTTDFKLRENYLTY